MTTARETLNFHVKNVPHHLKEAFEERAARAICRTNDPYDVLKAYENRTIPENEAKWEMIVALSKASLTGHFPAEVISRARFEVG